MKKKITLENLICLFILLCPILDIVSFLFRNYFNVTFSPSTLLRPIIPIICFIILFFKEKNKKQKIIISFIYLIYSIIHLMIFQKLHNGSSYGNIKNEFQYIINYSFLIINLYLFFKLIKDKKKINKIIFIILMIYIFSLFFSIITKTSTTTYLEGIGYKGYFESGNSLCTVLLLSICVLLSDFNLRDYKKIILIILAGIYLCVFSGMRTGLFGFSLIIFIYVISKLFINIKLNVIISKTKIILITSFLIITVVSIFIFGSNMLQRRKMLKEEAEKNIDQETMEPRRVTGDILEIYKKIRDGKLEDGFMSDEEKNAIVDLYNFAEKVKLSNVGNLRKLQIIYNVFLIKEQKNIAFILFGNGYKNQTGELVVEMEVPSMLLNFGIFGFILYFGPFLIIISYSLYKIIINRKKLDIELIMYFIGTGLAMALSTLSGYVYFNFSSMTITILLNVLLLKKVKELEN